MSHKLQGGQQKMPGQGCFVFAPLVHCSVFRKKEMQADKWIEAHTLLGFIQIANCSINYTKAENKFHALTEILVNKQICLCCWSKCKAPPMHHPAVFRELYAIKQADHVFSSSIAL